jgi:hypothetical protein
MKDKSITGDAESKQINIEDSVDVEFWSTKFDVSTDQLKEAVKVAGNSADAVEAYFNQ